MGLWAELGYENGRYALPRYRQPCMPYAPLPVIIKEEEEQIKKSSAGVHSKQKILQTATQANLVSKGSQASEPTQHVG